MGLLKCILIRMTLFGSGLRLRYFFCALAASNSVLFFPSQVLASDVSWTFNGATYPSAYAACPKTNDDGSGFGRIGNLTGVILNGPSAKCSYTYNRPAAEGGPIEWTSFSPYRTGDTCPTGTSLSSTTGGCERPKDDAYQKC
ncbi:hypothetical protein, partial [Pseudomonas savastanoi]